MRKETLWNRLLQAALLGYVTNAGNIIATAAIKRPLDEYADSVFAKAASEYNYDDFHHELGYVVVDPSFRNNKLATLLCEQICGNIFKP